MSSLEVVHSYARVLVLALSLLSIILWIIACKRAKEISFAGLFVPAFLLSLNTAAFFLTRVMHIDIDVNILNFWSVGVYLQYAITLVGVAITILITKRGQP